ncbi:MAG: hypothetical protein E6H57_13855 [Betaproteobacteria bacterium]|nr:MAG: hypothetical protein E6H57_13855 [Betaproteobacteria bacterium]
MKILRRLLFACFAVGCSPAIADEAQPSLYSFADVYRLTVNAAPEALAFAAATSAPQVRVALATQDAFAAAEPRFTVSQVPGPKGWMLLLAGLAAAGWVAHRRLTSGY